MLIILIYLFKLNSCFLVSVNSFDRSLTTFIDTIKSVGFEHFDFQITEKKFVHSFIGHISNIRHDTSFFRMYVSRPNGPKLVSHLWIVLGPSVMPRIVPSVQSVNGLRSLIIVKKVGNLNPPWIELSTVKDFKLIS